MKSYLGVLFTYDHGLMTSNIVGNLLESFGPFIVEVNFIISKLVTIFDFLGHYIELKYQVVTKMHPATDRIDH